MTILMMNWTIQAVRKYKRNTPYIKENIIVLPSSKLLKFISLKLSSQDHIVFVLQGWELLLVVARTISIQNGGGMFDIEMPILSKCTTCDIFNILGTNH